jgi:hypothetical protein
MRLGAKLGVTMTGSARLPSPDGVPTAESRRAGGIACLFFGAVFLIGGLLATRALARAWLTDARVYGWSKATATIIDAHLTPPGPTDRYPAVSVRFRYDYAGHSYESDRAVARPSDGYHDAYRWVTEWQPGSTVPCYVDPHAPANAVLRRDGLGWGVSIFVLFVATTSIGGVLAYIGVVALRRKDTGPDATKDKGTWAKRIVIGVVVMVVLALVIPATYFFGVEPLMLFARAKHWRALPCTIVASRVRTDRQSDNNTLMYAADIAFRYQLDGHQYASTNHQFLEHRNSSRADAAGIVARYPLGAQVTCYADPNEPTRALLDRSFPGVVLVGFLVPVIAIAVWWGIVASARRRRAR